MEISLRNSVRRLHKHCFRLCRKLAGILAASVIISFFCLTASAPLNAEPPAFDEYAIKAGFIFNFAKFVEWPAEAFRDRQSPLVICVIGKDPFGEKLDLLVNKTVAGRKLTVNRVATPDDIEKCHILFISGSERDRLTAILRVVKNRDILTISEIDNFSRSGGMINLFLDADKVRFEINVRSAERVRLKISSQLLKLAKIYQESH